MSSTELYVIKKNGDIEGYAEFQNSHRGGIYLWTRMVKEDKLKGVNLYTLSNQEYDKIEAESYSFLSHRDLWKTWKTRPLYEGWVLASTFDHVVIRRQDVPRLIDAYESYMLNKQDNGKFDIRDVGHIVAYPVVLRRLLNQDDWLGICWNQTSVNSNPYRVYGYEDGEDVSRSYNIFQDDTLPLWYIEETKEGLTNIPLSVFVSEQVQLLEQR